MDAVAQRVMDRQQDWLPQDPKIDKASLRKIQSLQKKIYRYLQPRSTEEEMKRLEYAFSDVAMYHGYEKRKSGEPVMIHPLRVAWSVCDAGLDAPSVIAALLHDIIEDTEVSRKDIKGRYGKWYADVVDGLTKIKYPTDSALKTQANLEATYQKMLVAMVKDVRALFIKLFDRLDNMRDLECMPRHKQRRISRETLGVYVPMAKRLGLHTLSEEHTELCFKYLYPRRYQQTLEHLENLKQERWPAIEGIQQQLDAAIKSAKLKSFSVQPILVHPASQVESKEMVDQILSGFRCLVSKPEDSYRALGVLHTQFRAIPLKIRDFISNPRWNGYRGLQTEIIVQGEVMPIEIVPKAMHFLNEHGIMSHWKGRPSEMSEYYRSYFEQLDQMVAEDDIRVDDVLRYVQADQIQLFTPNGDSYFFPKEATVLDFAYQVHTDLGNSCVGALVNPPPNVNIDQVWNERVPRDHKLHTGQTIYVLTDPEVKPQKSWLEQVVTARAEININRVLKQQNVLRARKIGEELLQRELERLGENPESFMSSENFQNALEEDGLTFERFLELLTLRKVSLLAFLKRYQLVDATKLDKRSLLKKSFIFKSWGTWFHAQAPDILIEDLNDDFIHLAECCAPHPYDAVIGVTTENHGLEVHRTNCPTLKQEDDSFQVPVGWNLPSEQEQPRRLRVTAVNQPGALYKTLKIINDLGADIEDSWSAVNPPDEHGNHDGKAMIHITLGPTSWKRYYKIVERLRTLKFVQKVG